jgi:hypothetical protein
MIKVVSKFIFVLLVVVFAMAFLPQAGQTTYAAPTITHLQSSYSLPSWWNKQDCDKGHFGNTAYVMKTWRGIEVCGPVNTSVSVSFFPGWSSENEFQCTELVKRYLYLAYGLKSLGDTNGYQVVDHYTGAYSIFHKVVNNGAVHMAPVEGDVLSYAPNHTAIVTTSNVNASGNGTITVFQQNISWKGHAVPSDTLTVSNWVIQSSTQGAGSVISWMTTRLVPTTINFSVTMPGIGSGGNTNPLHKTRQATLMFIDSNGNAAKTMTAPVNYNNGSYSGSVATTLSSGSYMLKIRLSNTLYKQFPGFFSSGATVNEPGVALVSGDINIDTRIDVLDYNILIGCYGSKMNTSSCIDKFANSDLPHNADLDDNGKVDGVDYNIYLRAMQTQKGS